jgi:hypothetical protein
MDNLFLRHQLGALHCIEPQATELFYQILSEEPVMAEGSRWINGDRKLRKAYVIADGWVVRYKLLKDGRRQILNFQIPGDMIGYFALLFESSAYAAEPLTPVKVHSFTPGRVFDIFGQAPEKSSCKIRECSPGRPVSTPATSSKNSFQHSPERRLPDSTEPLEADPNLKQVAFVMIN